MCSYIDYDEDGQTIIDFINQKEPPSVEDVIWLAIEIDQKRHPENYEDIPEEENGEEVEIIMDKKYPGFWTLKERLAFEKLSLEEMEAEIQKGKEEDAKLTEWPPVPDSYLDI